MDKKSTYIIAGIVVLAIVVFVVISFQKTTLDTNTPVNSEVASTTDWVNAPANVTVTDKTVITAKHAYQKGQHIVAGEIPLPTPCDILETNALASADKKAAVFQFMTSIKSGAEMCAQVITPARFKVSITADKDAKLTATLNGQPVTLNLIEAAPGENLDNFELYIKG